MEFYKAPLLNLKFGKCGWGYWRLANASQLFLWVVMVTWRRPWLPQAAYMEGWNAAFRQFGGLTPRAADGAYACPNCGQSEEVVVCWKCGSSKPPRR